MSGTVKAVHDLQRRIDALHQQQDEIVEPLVKRVIKDDDPGQINALILKLPRGFYASELRTLHFMRLEDENYRCRAEAVDQATENGAASTSSDDLIEKAHAIQRQIDALDQEQSAVIKSLVEQAIRDNDPKNTRALLSDLPTNYYKSELQTWHRARMEDPEYRDLCNAPSVPKSGV